MIIHVIFAIWIALFALWIAAAAAVKTTVRRAGPGSRLPQIILVGLGYWLVFDTRLQAPLLNVRFVPIGAAGEWVGLMITIAGVAFAVWARFSLGRNWSAEVTVKEDHELKRDGPYGFVRHPIYSGFLLGLLGTAIAIGEIRGLIGLMLATFGWRLKSLLEERVMLEQFGEQYERYKRDVKALIPFVY